MAYADLESEFYSYHDTTLNGESGFRAYTLTGVGVFTVQGGGGGRWKQDKLALRVKFPDLPDFPPKNGVELHHWAPFFTLNSISNDGVANDAGWAVDRWVLNTPTDRPTPDLTFTIDLAVGDSDGFILRVGYMIDVLGKIV
jgi:hypothetical protein